MGVNTANLQGKKIVFQNINFAVKGTVVQKFLAKNNINFTNNENEQLMKTADIADMGKKFTTQIICTSILPISGKPKLSKSKMGKSFFLILFSNTKVM